MFLIHLWYFTLSGLLLLQDVLCFFEPLHCQGLLLLQDVLNFYDAFLCKWWIFRFCAFFMIYFVKYCFNIIPISKKRPILQPFLSQGVRFTFRLAWEYGTGPCGPTCSTSSFNKLGHLPPTLSRLRWVCASGCAAQNMVLSDVNYYSTYGSPESGLEEGENIFFYHFNSSGPFEVA